MVSQRYKDFKNHLNEPADSALEQPKVFGINDEVRYLENILDIIDQLSMIRVPMEQQQSICKALGIKSLVKAAAEHCDFVRRLKQDAEGVDKRVSGARRFIRCLLTPDSSTTSSITSKRRRTLQRRQPLGIYKSSPRRPRMIAKESAILFSY
jgi:hypothetical protein